jgi:hypothetical protein
LLEATKADGVVAVREADCGAAFGVVGEIGGFADEAFVSRVWVGDNGVRVGDGPVENCG